jgi:Flp pilus assembly pilin Flp
MMTKLYVLLQGLANAARDGESGQTMAEYAVVLAVVTVAIVGALILLSNGINATLSSVTSTL